MFLTYINAVIINSSHLAVENCDLLFCIVCGLGAAMLD